MGRDFGLWIVSLLGVVTIGICRDPDLPFEQNFINTSVGHVNLLDKNHQAQLILDNTGGAMIESKNYFLFGHFSMKMKLIPGDSAGTVTSFYLYSVGLNHDEIDFEFLGNLPKQKIILSTNIFVNGTGNREQRINLWFDPTADFHSYSFTWNKYLIALFVDGIPIRIFKNLKGNFPRSQPMKIYATVWDGSGWATDGGKVKINMTNAPFVATYKGFYADGCMVSNTSRYCPPRYMLKRWKWSLDATQKKYLLWVREFFTIYNYCEDVARYPKPPPECQSDLDI